MPTDPPESDAPATGDVPSAGASRGRTTVATEGVKGSWVARHLTGDDLDEDDPAWEQNPGTVPRTDVDPFTEPPPLSVPSVADEELVEVQDDEIVELGTSALEDVPSTHGATARTDRNWAIALGLLFGAAVGLVIDAILSSWLFSSG